MPKQLDTDMIVDQVFLAEIEEASASRGLQAPSYFSVCFGGLFWLPA